MDERMTWKMFDEATRKLASRITRLKESGAVKSVFGVPRGGLVTAVRLSYLLNLPLVLDPTEIQSHTLVIDDIADSGRTLEKYKNSLIATLYYSQKSLVTPEFWIFKKKDKWIVFPWET